MREYNIEDMILKIKSVILLLFFVVPTLYAEQEEVQEAIEALAKTYWEEHGVVGMAVVATGRENHELFEKTVTLGNLSLKSPIPVNHYTEFRIGPLTQLFTAATLAYLVQEGQVSLNDPVSKFLPRSQKVPTYQEKQITLGDLATHTSGLPDMPYSLTSRSSFSVSQMQRFLAKYELPREPGTKYEYSNFGYAFLANILSRIAKRPFPDLCEQLIMHPLNLSDTQFLLTPEQKKRLSTGYEHGKGISPLLSEKVYSVFIGSGGLYSTPKDMLSFLLFNLGKVRTSLKAILPIMQTPYHTFSNFQMGLGWKITTLPETERRYYYLSGTLFGFGMFIGMVPDQDAGVVILTNQGDFDPDLLGDAMIRRLAE